MSQTTLPEQTLRELAARLKAQHEAFARLYPGESGTRQPVHTVYGGGPLFQDAPPEKTGDPPAEKTAEEAPTASSLPAAAGRLPRGAASGSPRRPAVEAWRGFGKGAWNPGRVVEPAQPSLDPEGPSMPPKPLGPAKGRMRGAHSGPSAYTPRGDIPAASQAMGHPACDFAKHMMK